MLFYFNIGEVDGSWSEWSEQECSATCGIGQKVRIRLCNLPEPQNGGDDCIGEPFETVRCTIKDCTPGISKVQASICNETVCIIHENKSNAAFRRFTFITTDESNWCSIYLKGHNCARNETIVSEEGCKLAAKSYGLGYEMSVEAANYAAGCFMLRRGVFFNRITDPALTYQDKFLLSGGICLNTGKITSVCILAQILCDIFKT